MKRLALGGLIAAACVGLAFRRVEGPRIAVVDMSRLVSQHKQSRDEQDLIVQWRKTNDQLLEERRKKYMEEVAGRDQFKPGSDELKKKERELKLKKFELENDAQSLNDEGDRRVAKSIADSYARVAAACKQYQESQDLDAVMLYAATPANGEKPGEVINEIVVRTVVAYKKTIDATDAVLAILDAGK